MVLIIIYRFENEIVFTKLYMFVPHVHRIIFTSIHVTGVYVYVMLLNENFPGLLGLGKFIVSGYVFC